jgi:hypothetical protein
MTYNGYCPKWGKWLVKNIDGEWVEEEREIEVRCPSCGSRWHQLSELEWEEK